MTSDALFKKQAAALLERIGFTCSVVQEGAAPSADLRAIDSSGQAYLFELKARTTTWQSGATPVSPRGGAAEHHRIDPTAPSNSLARVFEKAAVQLATSADGTPSLRLLWFAAEPSDLHYHYTRIVNTAYGITNVASAGRPVRQGFYVRHAAFATWSEQLDGVLLGGFAALLLNDLSPRYQILRQSALATQLGEFVSDPPVICEREECYYLDPREDGATPERSVERLSQRYGLTDVHLVDLVRFAAAVGGEGD